MNEKLSAHFTNEKIALTGSFRRQLETIDVLEWCTTASSHDLKKFFIERGLMRSGKKLKLSYLREKKM
jgi:hypothetical protein